MISYSLWSNREQWANLGGVNAPTSWWIGVCIGSSVWFAGWAFDTLPVQALGLYLTVVTGTAVLLGKGSLHSFVIQIAIIIFALPVWFELIPLLQSVSTSAVQTFLSLLGVIVYFNGFLIETPRGVFEIADSCSGLGFLLAGLALFSFLLLDLKFDLRRTVIVIGAVVLFAMLSNWIRIILIVLAGYHYGFSHPIVSEHVLFGWIVFMVLGSAPAYFGMRWLAKYQVEKTISHRVEFATIKAKRILSLVAIVAAFPTYAFLIPHLTTDQSEANTKNIDSSTASTASLGWEPRIDGVDFVEFYTIESDGQVLERFIGGYKKQPYSIQLVDKWRGLIPAEWQYTKFAKEGDAKHYLLLTKPYGNDRIAVKYWFEIGGMIATSRHGAKVQRAIAKLQGREDISLHAVAALCEEENCQNALQALHTVE